MATLSKASPPEMTLQPLPWELGVYPHLLHPCGLEVYDWLQPRRRREHLVPALGLPCLFFHPEYSVITTWKSLAGLMGEGAIGLVARTHPLPASV